MPSGLDREGQEAIGRLRLTGEKVELLVPVHKTLLEVLREDLGLTGTKHGCELGECGTCTVLVDGRPELSCLLLPVQLEGREVTTIQGLGSTAQMHPLQMACAERGAAQCGCCTLGVLLAASALSERERQPDGERIRSALAGNLCRCTGYVKILEAVELAARRRADEGPAGTGRR